MGVDGIAMGGMADEHSRGMGQPRVDRPQRSLDGAYDARRPGRARTLDHLHAARRQSFLRGDGNAQLEEHRYSAGAAGGPGAGPRAASQRRPGRADRSGPLCRLEDQRCPVRRTRWRRRDPVARRRRGAGVRNRELSRGQSGRRQGERSSSRDRALHRHCWIDGTSRRSRRRHVASAIARTRSHRGTSDRAPRRPEDRLCRRRGVRDLRRSCRSCPMRPGDHRGRPRARIRDQSRRPHRRGRGRRRPRPRHCRPPRRDVVESSRGSLTRLCLMRARPGFPRGRWSPRPRSSTS